MAGYFNPNLDYSAEMAKTSDPAKLAQLEAERNNKINASSAGTYKNTDGSAVTTTNKYTYPSTSSSTSSTAKPASSNNDYSFGGTSFKMDYDYQDAINKANAAGNSTLAGVLNTQRNAKIDYLGGKDQYGNNTNKNNSIGGFTMPSFGTTTAQTTPKFDSYNGNYGSDNKQDIFQFAGWDGKTSANTGMGATVKPTATSNYAYYGPNQDFQAYINEYKGNLDNLIANGSITDPKTLYGQLNGLARAEQFRNAKLVDEGKANEVTHNYADALDYGTWINKNYADSEYAKEYNDTIAFNQKHFNQFGANGFGNVNPSTVESPYGVTGTLGYTVDQVHPDAIGKNMSAQQIAQNEIMSEKMMQDFNNTDNPYLKSMIFSQAGGIKNQLGQAWNAEGGYWTPTMAKPTTDHYGSGMNGEAVYSYGAYENGGVMTPNGWTDKDMMDYVNLKANERAIPEGAPPMLAPSHDAGNAQAYQASTQGTNAAYSGAPMVQNASGFYTSPQSSTVSGAPTGTGYYNKDTDYEALYNQAVASGNFSAANQYADMRYNKMVGEGLLGKEVAGQAGKVYQDNLQRFDLGTGNGTGQNNDMWGMLAGQLNTPYTGAQDYMEQMQGQYDSMMGAIGNYQSSANGIIDGINQSTAAGSAELNHQKDLYRQQGAADNSAAQQIFYNTTNPNGAEAERLAAMGLTGSGLTESSVIDAGNTLQSQVNQNERNYQNNATSVDLGIANLKAQGATAAAQALSEISANTANMQMSASQFMASAVATATQMEQENRYHNQDLVMALMEIENQQKQQNYTQQQNAMQWQYQQQQDQKQWDFANKQYNDQLAQQAWENQFNTQKALTK